MRRGDGQSAPTSVSTPMGGSWLGSNGCLTVPRTSPRSDGPRGDNARTAGAVQATLATVESRAALEQASGYAGFTFMWIAAVVAHYLAGDGALTLLPVALLRSLAVSHVTRPANRGGSAKRCWRS